MPCDYFSLPHIGIQTLKPYVPGKSANLVAQEHDLHQIVKLASNENPWGCSPAVIHALSKLTPQQIATYPLAAIHPLRKKLALKETISPDMITFGNGTDSLFPIIQTCFALHTDKHILTHDYSFIAYRIHAQTLGIPVKSLPLKPNWHVDIDAIIKNCTEKTALIFLANPNNPTGILTPFDEIQRLLNAIPSSTLLILDEAYIDYVLPTQYGPSIQLLSLYPNLVLTRTFSKIYGLASLRLGYSIAHTSITALLHRVLPPFTVNEIALIAAMHALEDQDFLIQSRTNNHRGRQQLENGLHTLGLHSIPTAGNFIFFDCKHDTLPLYNALQEQGIIVRPLHPYGLKTYLRVTIGTQDQNAFFLAKMATLYPL